MPRLVRALWPWCLFVVLATSAACSDSTVDETVGQAGGGAVGATSTSGTNSVPGGAGGSVTQGGATSGRAGTEATSGAGQGGAGGEAGDDSPSSDLPSFAPDGALSAQELVLLSWDARSGARYSLDVLPTGSSTWVGPCVGDSVLGSVLSFPYDGRCPSAASQDVKSVQKFRLCSSIPKTNGTWDPASAACAEFDYAGGSQQHLPGTPAANVTALYWPYVPGAAYALHLDLKDGTHIDNCVSAALLGSRTSFAFDGACPSANLTPGRDAVATVRVDAALGGHWELGAARRHATAPFSATTRLELEFEGFRNHYFAEKCGRSNAADPTFPSGVSLDADVCVSDGSYLKRRYVDRSQTGVMAYPRSYTDPEGVTYALFATPPGGFTPAGNKGCSELNLVRTKDFKSYEVFQVERLCGYSRLDNGELSVIDGKLYVTYHTITANGACTATGNVPGREWTIRLKASADYASATPHFTDLAGADGFDAVHSLCLPNASSDGTWEPMVYQAADGSFKVAYTDDTPPETADGKCNQYLRVLTYDLKTRKATSNVAVGDCPGDKRDGMPVVAKNADGKYFMVLESLGAPSSQIVLLESNDGGSTFGDRRVLADVATDGGKGMGCPYLAFAQNAPYVSFYHTYDSPSGARFGAFEVRGFTSEMALRSEQVVEARRHWTSADDLDILYWGGIHLKGDHLHLVGSAWSHPFTEAWVPLL